MMTALTTRQPTRSRDRMAQACPLWVTFPAVAAVGWQLQHSFHCHNQNCILSKMLVFRFRSWHYLRRFPPPATLRQYAHRRTGARVGNEKARAFAALSLSITTLRASQAQAFDGHLLRDATVSDTSHAEHSSVNTAADECTHKWCLWCGETIDHPQQRYCRATDCVDDALVDAEERGDTAEAHRLRGLIRRRSGRAPARVS